MSCKGCSGLTVASDGVGKTDSVLRNCYGSQYLYAIFSGLHRVRLKRREWLRNNEM